MKKTKELMKDVPVADPRSYLEGIDGVIVGTSTRLGNMCALIRNFWDQIGAAWVNNTLVGKPVAVFTGSNTQLRGKETIITATHLTLLYQGCMVVGLSYTRSK